MSQHAQLWDWTLTPRENDLQKTFFNLLKMDNKKLFSANDFYDYGLQRFFSDPNHMVGSLFRKLAHAGLIEEAGHIASSRPQAHRKEIKLWRLKP